MTVLFVLCNRACTNSSAWVEHTRTLEVFSHSILDNLRKVRDIVTEKQSIPMSMPLECLLSSSDDISMRTSMMKFVRNASLLCLNAFPQNYILEEAVLVAEELSNTRMNSLVSTITPCRSLAKNLLKNNRQVYIFFQSNFHGVHFHILLTSTTSFILWELNCNRVRQYISNVQYHKIFLFLSLE